MAEDFGVIVSINLQETYKNLDNQMKIVQDWFIKNHKLNIGLNLSPEAISGLEKMGAQFKTTVTQASVARTEVDKFIQTLKNNNLGNTVVTHSFDDFGKLNVEIKNAENELVKLKYQFDSTSKSFQLLNENTKVFDSLTSGNSSRAKMGLGQELAVAFEKFPLWLGVSTVVMGVVHGFEDAYKAVVEFDTGLAGMRQTLEETYASMGKVLDDKEMNRIGQGFTQIAERWGQSVNEILTAGKTWSRQYKDVDEVMNLVNNSVLLSVVDNVNLENSVKSLEATMNQWGKTARNAAEANQFSLEIVDKWSALAHKQMATANDLADANARTGAVARQTGVDFDHMQGLTK